MHRVNVSECITLSTYIKSVEIYFFMCYNVCDMNIEYYRQAVFGQFKEKFEKLYEMLVNGNKMYNLTAIIDKDDVFIKHFLDSVVGEKYFIPNAKVCEVGSGGGFPSIPLKILRDDISFTLIESTGKKCDYLKSVVDNFAFCGVQVMNIRAEDGARMPELREKFDAVTARAVARLNTLCEYCLPFARVGGRFIAYKGRCEEELEESLNAVKTLGGRVECVEKFELNGEKRTIVVIEKVASTPQKYPRGRGLERKRPL